MSKPQTQSTRCRIDGRRARRLINERRGAAAVFGVFLLASLVVMCAVTIDYGFINTSRSEIKRTADAAAMSGAWELFDGVVEGESPEELNDNIAEAASTIAAKNTVGTQTPALCGESDVQVGYYSTLSPGELDTSDPDMFNAVRVHVRQTDEAGSAIPLFLGGLTGRHEQSLQANSTAALFKQVGGFYSPPDYTETLDILPIALDLETWELVAANSTEDNYAYSGGNVSKGSGDGYCECSLYPTGTGSPGNRGTVDIGGANNSTSDIRRQILHGISKQDMMELGKPLEFDGAGELTLNGDTGLSAGIKAQLAQIIGQPRIIPIFNKVHGNGNNATYTICRWEGIRILSVKLTGPMKKKHVTIQPAPMIARRSIYKEEEFAATDFYSLPSCLSNKHSQYPLLR